MNKVDFWDRLIEEVTPFLTIGKELMEEITDSLEQNNIELTHLADYESLPPTIKSSIGEILNKALNSIEQSDQITQLIQSKDVYIALVEMLEKEIKKPNNNSKLIKSVLIQQMQEVIKVSVTTTVMNLNDWKGYIDSLKETQEIEHPIEYVYHKLRNQGVPKDKIEIQNFFYNKYSWSEIESLLAEAKEYLDLANEHRNTTQKKGQGMTRFILDFILKWQNEGYMKNVQSIYPFIHCLEEYWNCQINLGTRQGVERSYKQRTIFKGQLIR